MELSQLKYFLEVADLQHMTAAAERLHIAQPALSQSIKRLESELGVPLFERNGRGIVLTRYGKYLQKHVGTVLKTLEDIPENLRAMAKLENSTIHINLFSASVLMTEAIIVYKKKAPHVYFQIIQNNDMELSDISVQTRSEFKETDDDSFCFTEEIMLAVPKNGRFGNRRTIQLWETEGEPFVSLSGNRQFRAVCDEICKREGFSPNIVFESDNVESVKNIIAANMGVGFWPKYSWGKIKDSDIVLLSIQKPRCNRDLLVTRQHHKNDNREVDRFYEFLKEYFANTKAGVE